MTKYSHCMVLRSVPDVSSVKKAFSVIDDHLNVNAAPTARCMGNTLFCNVLAKRTLTVMVSCLLDQGKC